VRFHPFLGLPARLPLSRGDVNPASLSRFMTVAIDTRYVSPIFSRVKVSHTAERSEVERRDHQLVFA